MSSSTNPIESLPSPAAILDRPLVWDWESHDNTQTVFIKPETKKIIIDLFHEIAGTIGQPVPSRPTDNLNTVEDLVKLSAVWWRLRKERPNELIPAFLQAGETLSNYLETLGVPKGVNSDEMIEAFRTSPLFTTPVSALHSLITEPRLKGLVVKSNPLISLGALVIAPKDMKEVSLEGRSLLTQPSYFTNLVRQITGNPKLNPTTPQGSFASALKKLELILDMTAAEIGTWDPENLEKLAPITPERPSTAPAIAAPRRRENPWALTTLPPRTVSSNAITPSNQPSTSITISRTLDWMQDLPTRLLGYEKDTHYRPCDGVDPTDIEYINATFTDLTHKAIPVDDAPGVEIIQAKQAPYSGAPTVANARDAEFESLGPSGKAIRMKVGEGKAAFDQHQRNIDRHAILRDIGYVYEFASFNTATNFAMRMQNASKSGFPPAIRKMQDGSARVLVPNQMIEALAGRYGGTIDRGWTR